MITGTEALVREGIRETRVPEVLPQRGRLSQELLVIGSLGAGNREFGLRLCCPGCFRDALTAVHLQRRLR